MSSWSYSDHSRSIQADPNVVHFRVVCQILVEVHLRSYMSRFAATSFLCATHSANMYAMKKHAHSPPSTSTPKYESAKTPHICLVISIAEKKDDPNPTRKRR